MNLKANSKDFSRLISFNSAGEVLQEVLEISSRVSSDLDTQPVRKVFDAAEDKDKAVDGFLETFFTEDADTLKELIGKDIP